MQWINMRDRIPEKNGYYLVYRVGETYCCSVKIGLWNQNRWNADDSLNNEVTHWMPLPNEPLSPLHPDEAHCYPWKN